MQCQYCGNEFLVGLPIIGDTDFCCRNHRQVFHQRLTTAVRRIQDEASGRPAGQPGFRALTAVFDRAPQPMSRVFVVPARLRPTLLSGFQLAGVSSEVLGEPPVRTEAPVEAAMLPSEDETAVTIHPPDPASQLKRVAAILAGIRGEIEKRRRDTPVLFGQRGRAPVIQLKPAV